MRSGAFSAPDMKKVKELFLKYKWILLALAAGVILLLLPGEQTGSQTDPDREGSEISFDLKELEERMEEVLSQIDGAGKLSLVLTLKSSAQEIHATDREYTQDGDRITERSTIVLRSGTDSAKKPAVIRYDHPVFLGALVVCEGGDNPSVRLSITKAVSALTGLSTDRITVCK